MKRKAQASRPGPGIPARMAAALRRTEDLLGPALERARHAAGPMLEGIRQRPVLAGAGALCLTAGLALGLISSGDDESAGQDPAKAVVPLAMPLQPDKDDPTGANSAGELAETSDSRGGMDADDLPGDEEQWETVEVRSGETLERVFQRMDLGPGLLHEVVNLDERTEGLARIRPGDRFDFRICPDEGLQAMRAEYDEGSWLLVERNGTGDLASRTVDRAVDVKVVEASAQIRSSLFNAGSRAGLSDGMLMRLANIFGWDIDFALDIRSGDSFALVYERLYRDGEFLRDGQIVAARFTNRGSSFEAFRFETADGADYYNPDGRPMRRAFLRAPLNFTRVTSDFNPNRFHPVTQRNQPHNGIDYGAPTGTPVWASGDGRVIRSSYNNANGNYVFIRHGNNIVTKYLHLHRRSVDVGDRVRQGDTIGQVGATGMATGPHLHYEFVVDGRHRNPRTVDLPEADPLPEDYLEQFEAKIEPLAERLGEADRFPVKVASGGE